MTKNRSTSPGDPFDWFISAQIESGRLRQRERGHPVGPPVVGRAREPYTQGKTTFCCGGC